MLDTCPDIKTAEVGAGESLPAHIERTLADVLIISQERLSDASTPALLELYPHLRVLMLVSDAREAYVYELRLTKQELSGVSLEELVSVIRQGRATSI